VRINALKNYYLPRYKREIKEIKEAIEQIEREEIINLKISRKI